jgi:hypothetical protein
LELPAEGHWLADAEASMIGLLRSVEMGRAKMKTAEKARLWQAFTDAHGIARSAASLFVADDDRKISVVPYGLDRRPILQRSPEMEALVIREAEKCFSDAAGGYEGLIYLMHRMAPDGTIVPLYIGRAGLIGRNGGVSANLLDIRSNGGKFARWGYNYAYHFGDLSAAVLPGHAPSKIVPKYANWARALFENAPSERPVLRYDVRFWCAAWGAGSTGIWPEFGACSLSFIEYLLIGVASQLFPDDLLNREGVNAGEGTV